MSDKTGIAFIDSTPLEACRYKRASNHKVFKGVAEVSKSSKGWFFGLKLHLLINDKGQIVNLKFTKANVDDRKPVPHLTAHIQGLLFADKGYISQALFDQLTSVRDYGSKFNAGFRGFKAISY